MGCDLSIAGRIEAVAEASQPHLIVEQDCLHTRHQVLDLGDRMMKGLAGGEEDGEEGEMKGRLSGGEEEERCGTTVESVLLRGGERL
eukprot:2438447-Rhodomonas_salina.1